MSRSPQHVLLRAGCTGADRFNQGNVMAFCMFAEQNVFTLLPDSRLVFSIPLK
jgi:hypothetical protein